MNTSSLVLLFALIKIAIIHSQNIIKSASITPQLANTNGVYILTHLQEVTKDIGYDQWRISTSYQHTWQFIIILDDSWTFIPNVKSSVSFTIQSPTCIQCPGFTQANDDIILGFAVNDYEYISMSIPIGDNNPINTNKIYPNCYPTTNLKSDFANGDISTLPDFNRICDVANGDCRNWVDMQPDIPREYNSFPITVTFINDPNTNTLQIQFHSQSSSIQTCSFNSFPTNQVLKIYVGGNKNGQQFDINSFDFEKRIYTPVVMSQPTINPTQSTPLPTLNTPSPTLLTTATVRITSEPSTNPTLKPSMNPTLKPTLNPTLKPSINPVRITTTRPTRREVIPIIATITNGPIVWTDVYYDNMFANPTNDGWFTNNEVFFGFSSRHCPTTGQCVRMNGCSIDRGGDSFIEKIIDITGYNSIRLKVDFKASSLEANTNDQCEIWYAYGTDIDKELHAFTIGDIIYNDYVIDLPNPTSNYVKIILLANGESQSTPCNDRCYWGDFYVQGSK